MLFAAARFAGSMISFSVCPENGGTRFAHSAAFRLPGADLSETAMRYNTVKEKTNMDEVKNLEDSVYYKRKNGFRDLSASEVDEAYAYAEQYKKFLDASKTEREAVCYAVCAAEEKGYRPYHFGDKLAEGGKYYFNNRGKSLYLFRIGTEKPEELGIAISAAHIDSPRLDLKQNPLYEESGMGFFKTHYYGGIKKYQWTAIPLALHGVVSKTNGETVTVTIGEDESDPVFYINDLLPHLSANQMGETLARAIKGEQLNILLGTRPYSADAKDNGIKLNLMHLFHDKYGIVEEDFQSAELTCVPAFKARDVGLDRSLIGSYGHDDRVCSYAALTALLDSGNADKTAMVILADKEEIGSEGNTGMQTMLFLDLIDEIALAKGANPRAVRMRSKCLSADVNAAFDPNFPDVFEKMNSSYLNGGVCLTKYTGSRGKSGTNDASAEYVAEMRRLFEDNHVLWQSGELGKVDQGGGGTVAMYIAKYNIDTVDLGVPVISMHAPYEIIAKTDLYMTYKAFCAFNN